MNYEIEIQNKYGEKTVHENCSTRDKYEFQKMVTESDHLTITRIERV